MTILFTEPRESTMYVIKNARNFDRQRLRMPFVVSLLFPLDGSKRHASIVFSVGLAARFADRAAFEVRCMIRRRMRVQRVEASNSI